MRRQVVLFIAAFVVWGCTSKDGIDIGTSIRAWLDTLDPMAEVIALDCKGEVEWPPGSGRWQRFQAEDKVTAQLAEVVVRHLPSSTWDDVLEYFITNPADWLPRALVHRFLGRDDEAAEQFLQIRNLECRGGKLRSPPQTIGQCPNSTDGCEDDDDGDEAPRDEDPPPDELPPPSGDGA
jgi:hypothetical protein